MGIIKATLSAISGGLGDQWLEVIEADGLSPSTVMAPGMSVRPNDPRNHNVKGTTSTLSNGSIIHVYEGQFMMLLDGGKIVDYTAEPGYFKVDSSSLPSLFNGELGATVKESFNRVRFSGSTPLKQEVVFINLQEIRDIKFGTPSPVNYYDNFYNAELFLRSFGTYSIKIVDPIKFYVEVCDRSKKERIDINEVNEQYRNEFLNAFQASLNQMSADGLRISHVLSRGMDLAEKMQNELDAKWTELRGFEILSVGIGSISYSEESQELINLRNKGAMLSDVRIRKGYVQGATARGLEAAGSNSAGAGQTFMGMGIGMNAIGGAMAGFSQTNQMQMQQEMQQRSQQAPQQTSQDSPQTPQPPPKSEASVIAGAAGAEATSWICPECATNNTGNFCMNCGTKKPAAPVYCPNCGAKIESPNAKFCSECGNKLG